MSLIVKKNIPTNFFEPTQTYSLPTQKTPKITPTKIKRLLRD